MELTTHVFDKAKAVGLNAKPTPHRKSVDLAPILATKYAGHARAGSQIVQEGDDAGYFIYLIDGALSVSKSMTDGETQVIDLMLPDDLVHIAASDGLTAPFSIEALEASRFARFKELPKELSEQHLHDLRFYFLDRMGAAQARIVELMLRLGKGSAATRLACFLIELSMRLKALPGGEGANRGPKLNQQQLGELTGLTSVHVCRTLRRFTRDGLITTDAHSHITINNLEGLAEIADIDLDQLRSEIITRQ
ncbi:MAG: Crp/Fnr family transcriptional regulator [Sulfitobacter sp.]